MKPPALILAGGRSSRMGGREKCLLPMRGASILERIIASLSPQVGRIVINSNSDPSLFRDTGLAVLADAMPGRLGPLAGIFTALRWAEKIGASHVITVACDTPFLPADLVYRLGNAAATGAAVAASGGNLHATTGLWPVHYAGGLERELQGGTRRVAAWLADIRFAAVDYPSAPFDPFCNINTPADLNWARQMSSCA